MNKTSVIKKLGAGALLLSAALIAGCGSSLSGTYKDSNGIMSIKFDSGKAYMTTMVGTVESAYEVDGDKVILKSPQGNLVLDRKPDGSLEGPTGTLKKTSS